MLVISSLKTTEFVGSPISLGKSCRAAVPAVLDGAYDRAFHTAVA